MSPNAFNVLDEIFTEYKRARIKHGPMRSPHEGYAVLKEEVDEAWDAIKANDPVHARKEMIQVAAMALAYLLEVSPRADGVTAGSQPRSYIF